MILLLASIMELFGKARAPRFAVESFFPVEFNSFVDFEKVQ